MSSVKQITEESFYRKRLAAVDPIWEEYYLGVAKKLVKEGYESPRLLDNIIEALPRELDPEFYSVMCMVNPRLHENSDLAEKKSAKAIVRHLATTGFFEGTKYGLYKGSGKPGGAMKAYLDRKAEKLKKEKEKQKPEYKNNPAFGDASHHSNRKTRTEAVKVKRWWDDDGDGKGYEKGEVDGSFKKGKKKIKEANIGAIATDMVANDSGVQKQVGGIASDAVKDKRNLLRKMRGEKPVPDTVTAGFKPEGNQIEEKKAAKDYDGDGKVESGKAEYFGSRDKAIKKAMGKKVKHDCSSKVKHEEYGIGECIKEMHTLDEDGNITHYDVLFTNKVVKNVPVENLEVLVSEMHEHYINDEKNQEVLEGSMKQARKNVGADTCWDGYKAKGTKKKGGKVVPNCVKEEEIEEGSMKQARKNVGADTCWDGYTAKGTKKKGGKVVPNCVKEEDIEEGKDGLWDNIHQKRERMKKGSGEKKAKPGDKDYPKTLNVENEVLSTVKSVVREGISKSYVLDIPIEIVDFLEQRNIPLEVAEKLSEEQIDYIFSLYIEEEKKQPKNCGCGQNPCITYGKQIEKCDGNSVAKV